jgi:hypothetical protein
VATSLADPAAKDAGAQQPVGEPPAQPPADPSARSCANCGAPLQPGQDWCLQCGTAASAPGRSGVPRWRSGAVLLGSSAVLALAAAGAGYAALSKSKPRPKLATVTVPHPAAVAPPAATPAPVTPPASLGAAATPKPVLPAPAATPKVPPVVISPPKTTTPAITPPPSASNAPSNSGTSTSTTPSSSEAASEPQANALLLDTNAASSYNPNNYPPTDFGDPSLAIDGETSTGWTAIVEPSTAPKMAVGLLLDLKTPQKLGSIELVTATPGMSIQLLGANGAAPPATIADPAWVKLTTSKLAKKKREHIALTTHGQKFRYVVLWISRAPAAAVGTPQKPGHVVVDEIELFP